MVVLPCSMALKHMVHRTAAVAKVDGDSCVPSSSKLARMTEVMTDECSCGSSLSTLYTWHQIYILPDIYMLSKFWHFFYANQPTTASRWLFSQFCHMFFYNGLFCHCLAPRFPFRVTETGWNPFVLISSLV